MVVECEVVFMLTIFSLKQLSFYLGRLKWELLRMNSQPPLELCSFEENYTLQQTELKSRQRYLLKRTKQTVPRAPSQTQPNASTQTQLSRPKQHTHVQQ